MNHISNNHKSETFMGSFEPYLILIFTWKWIYFSIYRSVSCPILSGFPLFPLVFSLCDYIHMARNTQMSSLSWKQFPSLHGGSGLCCALLMTSCICAPCSAWITVQSLSTNTNPACSRTETISVGCCYKVLSRSHQQTLLIEIKLLYYLYSSCFLGRPYEAMS